MLDSNGFDQWAGAYDDDTAASDRDETYPFAGYQRVLSLAHRAVRALPKGPLLDLGFGTAALTGQLYDEGYGVYGLDFSPRMVEQAQARMPAATLLCRDLHLGLPPPGRTCGSWPSWPPTPCTT